MTPTVSQICDVLSVRPTFEGAGILTITALAPLSMVGHHTGKVFISQDAPTPSMLLGLMENALGLFVDPDTRAAMIKDLRKKHHLPLYAASASGYVSLLQHHVRVGAIVQPANILRFFDLWARNKLVDTIGLGASRQMDSRLLEVVNAAKRGDVTVLETAAARSGNTTPLEGWKVGDTIPFSSVSEYLPQFYPSPTLREYVLPEEPYQIRVETSKDMAAVLMAAFDDPAATLYLGNSEGFVEAEWRTL